MGVAVNVRASHATQVRRRPSAVAIMVSAVVALPMMMSAPGAGFAPGIALEDAERGFMPAQPAGVLTSLNDAERGHVPGQARGTVLSLSNADRGFIPG
jgi:hypothetical protein